MAFDYKEVNDGKAVELLKRQTTLLRGAGSEELDSERRREACVRSRRHNSTKYLPVRTSHMHSAGVRYACGRYERVIDGVSGHSFISVRIPIFLTISLLASVSSPCKDYCRQRFLPHQQNSPHRVHPPPRWAIWTRKSTSIPGLFQPVQLIRQRILMFRAYQIQKSFRMAARRLPTQLRQPRQNFNMSRVSSSGLLPQPLV